MRKIEATALSAVSGSPLSMTFLSGRQYPWGDMGISDFELHRRSLKDVHPRDVAEMFREDRPAAEDGWVGLRVPSLTLDVGRGEICRIYFVMLRAKSVIVADVYSGLTYNDRPYCAEVIYGYLPQLDGQQFVIWMTDLRDSMGDRCHPGEEADPFWDDQRWREHDARLVVEG